MASTRVLWLLAAATACLLQGSSAHVSHIVGASYGWKTPQNITFYEDWARGQKFSVGERLVFLFTSGLENVLEVSADDYEHCTQKVVEQMYLNGPAILELTRPGPHYYYSGIGRHCEEGQKLKIDVCGGAAAAAGVAQPQPAGH